MQALGLWPAWRLRAPAATSAEPDTETALVEATALPDKPAPIEQPVAVAVNTAVFNIPAEPVQPVQPVQPDKTPFGTMDWSTLNAAIQSCTRCELAASRTHAVPGVGDIHAEWLFIGEAPGANEDRQGEPFVGDAGKLLDAILAAIGLSRGNNVYIANVLKSRPPANRDPKPEEVATCLPFLERQIELIQPKLIVALGRFAAQSLLATDTPIGSLRGRVHRYRGVPLVVTYHPAYLLRNPLDKIKVWEDLVLARDTMTKLKKQLPE
jgi:uracil-DNA glycosylase family 4